MVRSVDPDKAAATEFDRGRLARCPRQITHRGWWDVFWRVKDQLEADNVSIVAGGLALFGLLAVFPTLAAAVAIYGLVASPDAINTQIQAFSGLLPEAGLSILEMLQKPPGHPSKSAGTAFTSRSMPLLHG